MQNSAFQHPHPAANLAVVKTIQPGLLEKVVERLKEAVKAFLIFRGLTPEKTHDIRKLVVQASAFEQRFNEFINLAAVLTP